MRMLCYPDVAHGREFVDSYFRNIVTTSSFQIEYLYYTRENFRAEIDTANPNDRSSGEGHMFLVLRSTSLRSGGVGRGRRRSPTREL